jgi:diguanylate cyclase (GGDEF)-like protein
MGLRGKIISLFFICFGAMSFLAMAILKSNLEQGFLAIEHKQATEQMQQLTRNLNGEIDRLNQVVYDWAYWDDVYNYAKHPTPKFIESQLPPSSLKATEIKLFAIIDNQGQILYSTAVNLTTAEPESAAAFVGIIENIKKRIERTSHKGEKACGVDMSIAGPILVCGQSIHKSDMTGDPVGAVVMGRLLNEGLLSKIQTQSNINFDLIPLAIDEAALPIAQENTIEIGQLEFDQNQPGILNALLYNLVGKPILIVRLKFPGDVSVRGQGLTWKVVRVLLLVTVLTGLALLICVHYLIIRRLRKLDHDLSSIWRNERWSGRLQEEPDRRDELNDLSSSINRMLGLIHKQMVLLEATAMTDPLTKIANRRAFDKRIAIEMAMHNRNHVPLSLLMIDVDYFKRYNDHYGHPAGDEMLKTLGQLLSQVTCRPSDLAARIGGEEFAVILPATDLDGACHVANLLSAKLEDQKIPHESSSVADHVTLSIGVTCAVEQEEVAMFIQRADKAMYNAKQTGRNKICALPPVNL